MGHHPYQWKDSWSSVMRLLHYISQRQQSQGQKKPSNNTISVITYLNDILVIVKKKLNLTVNREPIKVLWIMKQSQLKESFTKIQKKI